MSRAEPLTAARKGWLPARTSWLLPALALAGAWPAAAAPIPYSQARHFASNSTTRQVETRMGRCVAIGDSLLALGAPYNDLGGEDSGVVWIHNVADGALLQRLENPLPSREAYFGWSVAVEGSLVVVGVPEDNTGANDSGIAYVFNLASSTPTSPVFTLTNPNPAINDGFGWSVDISGSRVVVGTPDGNSGSGDAGRVYVFDLSSPQPAIPVLGIDNPEPAATNFGHAVAIEGNHLVASAIQEAGTGDTCRVHFFDLSSATPAQAVVSLADPSPAANDQFGQAVAITGNRVAVTAPLFDNGVENSGAAYVYDLASATPAVPLHVLPNPSPALNDQFGNSVTMAGNRIVVGAALDDQGSSDSGVACVFDLNSATPTVPVLTLGNPGNASGDEFGRAVALAGDRLVVTAPEDNVGIFSNVGSAYLFNLASGTPAVPAATFNNPSPSSHEEFGYAVAIDANLVVVGSQKDDKGASNAGSVSLFNLGSAVPEQPWLVIDNPAPTLNDYFGVAVAASGTKVAVAAYQDDSGGNNSGTVYLYDTASPTPGVAVRTLVNPSPHAHDQFGNALALSGNTLVVGCAKNDSGAVDSGSAYVYDLASPTPGTPVLVLDNPSPDAEDWFGYAVAISGTSLVVGAHQNDAGAADAGSAYVYDLAATNPSVPVLTLNNPHPAADDEFGYAVAISGPNIVIGCRLDDGGATDTGAAYLYQLGSAAPATPVATLIHPDPEPEEYFGTAVAVSGTRVVIGVPEDDFAATDSGCGYVYEISSATFPEPADRLVAVNQHPGEWLGFSVAIDGTNVLMGAPLHNANTVARGAAYLFDPDPPAPEMQVEQPPGTGLISGQASIQFGTVPADSENNFQTVTIRNVGTSELEVTNVVIEGGQSENFSADASGFPAVLQVDQVLQFEVAFMPDSAGSRATTLKIQSNAGGGDFHVTLMGQALSPADDTDGDGVNDVAELAMESLGFDWQVDDGELLQVLRAGANAAGLYGESQVEAMNGGAPVISVHPGTGRYKLTLPVETSVDLTDFELYPVQAPTVTIGDQGSLDLAIQPAGPKAFFRFSPR